LTRLAEEDAMRRGYGSKGLGAESSQRVAQSDAGEAGAIRLRHLVMCASLVALGSAVMSYRVFHGREKPAVSARASEAPAAPLGDPSASLADLERRLSALERRPPEVEAPSQGVRMSAPSPAPSAKPLPRKPPPTSEQLDRYAQTEGRDRTWADAYERDVRASFAAAFKDDLVREVSCGTSLCKIVVEHSSRATAGAFGRGFWTALPDGYAAAHLQPSPDEPGSGASSVIHVIRQGYAEAVLGSGSEL
jgi:hypothetical protein